MPRLVRVSSQPRFDADSPVLGAQLLRGRTQIPKRGLDRAGTGLDEPGLEPHEEARFDGNSRRLDQSPGVRGHDGDGVAQQIVTDGGHVAANIIRAGVEILGVSDSGVVADASDGEDGHLGNLSVVTCDLAPADYHHPPTHPHRFD